jgi:hypothetical protein
MTLDFRYASRYDVLLSSNLGEPRIVPEILRQCQRRYVKSKDKIQPFLVYSWNQKKADLFWI